MVMDPARMPRTSNGAAGGDRPLLFERLTQRGTHERRAWGWHDFLLGLAVVVIAAACGFWIGRMTAPIADQRPVIVVGPAKWA